MSPYFAVLEVHGIFLSPDRQRITRRGVSNSRYWTEVIIYFNYNPFSCVITWRKTRISWWACTWPGRDRNYLYTYVIERSLSFTIVNQRSSTIWNEFIRQFSSPRNHLWVPYMGLRHRQALAPVISCHPFLLVSPSRMGLRAHNLLLASGWVLSPALRNFNYWLIVIEQTAQYREVSTSVSASEISDLSLASVPAAGFNLVQHI